MNAPDPFVTEHARQITLTLDLLDDLLGREDWDPFQTIAAGTLLQNIYGGIENILRHQLMRRKACPPHAQDWHKQVLNAACVLGLVMPQQAEPLRKLLAYRHFHVHGYGHTLNAAQLRDLAESVLPAVKLYLAAMTGDA